MADNPFENINLSGNDSCNNQIRGCVQQPDIDDLSMNEQIKERYGQDTRFRKHLAHWVMWIVPVWLGCVLFIITFNNPFCFNLDSKVLITLLATTTVNVLGGVYRFKRDIPPKIIVI